MPEHKKHEVLLALIEHASRPAALIVLGLLAAVWLFKVRDPVFQLLNKAETVRYGSFEYRVKSVAASSNLEKQLQSLKDVSFEQLQLFLVIGREREHITYNGPEVTEPNLMALKRIGLLSDVRRISKDSLYWEVSQEGRNLHELIFLQLLWAIRGGSGT